MSNNVFNDITLGCGKTKCDPRSADQVMTHMVQERGRISQWIWQSVSESDVFLKILGKTKEFFPSGMGDTKREVILEIGRATRLNSSH